ncbi:MAG: AMP-binding protein [Prevotella histicola]|nr:AMP-binding protein [Prevotella histicola]
MTLQEFLSEWNNDSPLLRVHTSGSTGKPKPIWVEKQRMLNSARITCDFLGLQKHDTALLCMPLDYIAGKMVVVRTLERGMQLLSVKPSGHPLSSESLQQLENPERPITFAAMVPLQVYNSLQIPEERKRLMQIKHLIIGGGAIDEKLSEELKNFPNAVWSTYGMTETLSHIALRRLNGPQATEWYTPFEGIEVCLNHEKCLTIHAPAVCNQTLITNDIAELQTFKTDENEAFVRFRIIGRKDNVIDSGGVKIQIEEVERTLKPHLTGDFAITSITDEKFGEAVVLLTTLTDITIVDTICKKILPKFWQPRHIFHTDNIPQTETGKPARANIRQLARQINK